MADMSILKVIIGRRANGQHDHPPFNNLDKSVRGGMDWSVFVDVHGSGWLYDSAGGHSEDDEYSPRGSWLGFLLVPDDFAQAAVAEFGRQCSIATEEEMEWFYDQRHAISQPDEFVDNALVGRIEAKQSRGDPLTPSEVNAINPDHPAPGRVRNKRKQWSGFMTQAGITIKPELRKGNATWTNRPPIAGG